MEVMRIGGIGTFGSMPSRQMAAVQPADSVSKNIQNEISSAQRQKQALNSEGDMSAKEKMKKSQELQQEISSLNTQLRMREEEVQKEQKKVALSDEVRPVEEVEENAENKDISLEEQTKPYSPVRELENIEVQLRNTDKEEAEETEKAEETEAPEDTDMGASAKETKAVITGDTAIQQAEQHRKVIVRMKDAIAVLKGEIRQDEARGMDVEDKKAELEKQEQKMQRASSSQFTALGEANKAMREARQEAQGKAKATVNASSGEQNTIKATNFSKDNNAGMQFFIR